MRVPAFPSSHYRRMGWKPVYWNGLVVWMTTEQYERTGILRENGEASDATEEQIARQDSWRERALQEEEREAEEFSRLFNPSRWLDTLSGQDRGGATDA
jgi:hypothetical protein